MKIGFYSAKPSSPSSQFYATALQKINAYKEHSFSFVEKLEVDKLQEFDVVLYFGNCDPKISTKRPFKLGLLDPRADSEVDLQCFDFVVFNGIESRDFFSDKVDKSFVYWVFPEAPAKTPLKAKKTFVLGYHGNRFHLRAMYPRITDAINRIADEYDVELWAMYNFRNKHRAPFPEYKFKFKVEHINFSESKYSSYMANADVGIIPQIIPVKNNRIFRFLIGNWKRKHNEHYWDYFLRFKETTNIGRAILFSQYKIPVVADMTPSACRYIREDVNGFVAASTGGWYKSIRKLIEKKQLREKLGEGNFKMYQTVFKPEVQNDQLIRYLEEEIL